MAPVKGCGQRCEKKTSVKDLIVTRKKNVVKRQENYMENTAVEGTQGCAKLSTPKPHVKEVSRDARSSRVKTSYL